MQTLSKHRPGNVLSLIGLLILGSFALSFCAWHVRTVSALAAGTGELDTTFSSTGKVRLGFGYGSDFHSASALLPNGKIILSGSTVDGGANEDFGLVRFNADGTLDTSFGVAGKVITSLGSDSDLAAGMVVQPDGKIVLAGYTPSQVAIARYNPDGSLDTSFDGDGKITVSVSGVSAISRIALQADGKYLLGGTVGTGNGRDFTVLRFTSNGLLDPTFDGDGVVVTAIGTTIDVLQELVLQGDGKIVAGGYSFMGTTDDFSMVRYNTDGSLDTSFDTDGKVTTAIGTSSDRINSIAFQPDGKIVAGGQSIGTFQDFALARYNTDGSLDTSFSGDGFLVTQMATDNDSIASVVIQADGNILTAGSATGALGANLLDIAIARYDAAGNPDPTFSDDGRLVTSISIKNDSIRSLNLQPDGKIVGAGIAATGRMATTSGDNDFAVVRFNSNGTFDTSFDNDGFTTINVGNGTCSFDATAIQADGKIIAAGYTWAGFPLTDFAVTRFNTDGSLDTTFGAGGKVTTVNGTYTSRAHAVALQPDGKILVGGYLGINDVNHDFAMARYNSDGSLDTSFDSDGKVTLSFGTGRDVIRSIAIQSDGKIVAAGYSVRSGSSDDFTLVRWNTDGSLDTSFNGTGIVFTPIGIGSSIDQAYDLAIQPDGKLVVAGYATVTGSSQDFALARYNSNGSLDTTFDTDGKVITAFGTGADQSYSVALQSDGKIIAGGVAANGSDQDFAIARYNADGLLDTTFDTDGMVTTTFSVNADQIRAMELRPNGKIIAAGYANSLFGSPADFALARYDVNGALDMSFSGDGKATIDFDSENDTASALSLDSSGRAVMAGVTFELAGIARVLIPEGGGTPTPTNTSTNTSTPTATPTSVETPSISGTVIYGNAIGAPTPRFVSNVTITGTGSLNVVTTTAAPGASAGQYTLTGFGAGSYTVTPTKTGGVNNITSFDAARISQHVAGPPNPQLTGNQLVVADVSGNTSVTSFDAAMIAKFAAGPPYAAPGIGSTATWRFTPVNRLYVSVNSSIAGEDFSALLMGEVSGNWNNTGARPARTVNSEQWTKIVNNGQWIVDSDGKTQNPITVTIQPVVSAADNEIVVPVKVQGIADKGVISYEFDLRYDPSVMQPVGDVVDVKDTISRGLVVVTNATEPGLLRVVVYGAYPIDGAGLLLNLCFAAVGGAGSVSPISFERIMFNEGESRVLVNDGKIELF